MLGQRAVVPPFSNVEQTPVFYQQQQKEKYAQFRVEVEASFPTFGKEFWSKPDVHKTSKLIWQQQKKIIDNSLFQWHCIIYKSSIEIVGYTETHRFYITQ